MMSAWTQAGEWGRGPKLLQENVWAGCGFGPAHGDHSIFPLGLLVVGGTSREGRLWKELEWP